MKLWSVEKIFNFWLPNGEVLLSMFCGKEWNTFTGWEGQLLFCLLQVYSSSSFLFHSFKLRNVVIENENTLNIQFFYLKWKKKNLTHDRLKRVQSIVLSPVGSMKAHHCHRDKDNVGEKRSKKGNTEHLKIHQRKHKKCLTLVWTMLLIVIQLGCLTCIFRIHCYMEMTFLKLS